MHDGSRCFLDLPATSDWCAVRDHVAKLPGAKLTGFLTDQITEAWIDFRFRDHRFTIHDPTGDYWFFVSDPNCPEQILVDVADHFGMLLRPPTAPSNYRLERP